MFPKRRIDLIKVSQSGVSTCVWVDANQHAGCLPMLFQSIRILFATKERKRCETLCFLTNFYNHEFLFFVKKEKKDFCRG